MYRPSPAGEPRPAPPKPDTPNTGNVHSSLVPEPVLPNRRAWFLAIVVFCWVVFDVVERVAF